jgi:hypothetical protein
MVSRGWGQLSHPVLYDSPPLLVRKSLSLSLDGFPYFHLHLTQGILLSLEHIAELFERVV